MDRCGIACVWILFVLQCNTQKCLIRVFWALLVSLAKEAGNIEGSTEAAEFSASRVQRCLTVYLPNFAPALGVPGVEKAQRNRFDGRPTLSASQGNAIHPSAPPLSLHNWDKERFLSILWHCSVFFVPHHLPSQNWNSVSQRCCYPYSAVSGQLRRLSSFGFDSLPCTPCLFIHGFKSKILTVTKTGFTR